VLSPQINHVVKPFLYKLACLYFPHLQSNLCTDTCYTSCILLLCSPTQKTKSSLLKTSFRRAGPWSSTCGTVLILQLRPLGLVISFRV
jgi:hypothetical protein